MKAQDIQNLIDFIAGTDLDEVKIETESLKLAVKRNSVTRVIESASPVMSQPIIAAPVATPVQQAAVVQEAAGDDAEGKYLTVKSPMIGTFYRSANPESPKFVEVGGDIKKGQTVCIVEAMKLFNEIESDISGKVVKILVEDATPVEYDQPLFLVDPS